MIRTGKLVFLPFYGRIQVNLKTCSYILLFLPFFSIDVLWHLLGPVYRIWQVVSLILLFVNLVKAGGLKCNWFHIWYIVYVGFVLLSAVKHGTLVPGMVFVLTANLILILYVERFPDMFLSVVKTITIVLLPLNLISMAYFDEVGFYDTTVLRNRYSGIAGGKNGYIVYLVPLAILCIYSLYRQGKSLWWGNAAFVFSMFMCFMAKSATGMLIGAFVTVIYFFRRNLKFSYKFWLLASLAVYIGLIVGNQAFLNGYLGEAVFRIVGHKNTFAIRLMIWNQMISMMKGSWLLGIGRGSNIPVALTETVVVKYGDVHNMLLCILRNCGLLGFFAYGMSVVHAVRRKHKYNSGEAVLFIGVICILAAGLMEDRPDFPYLWILLAFMDVERKLRMKEN